ncbi:DUF6146 family protein [Moheibacter sediminis]|uniref:Uncharacterized protein n=1 Tax=Moheibacter sediminis TaxID=1434700 RepID=A0A1W2CHW6_9FLAO|nr:DUF6146 family protein [Moheibacter sediminis]SMC84574.1 hypothetical protein SAMN06296427_11085 [Moheibacter sediminis]
MKKIFLLILILPFVSWAQVDSLGFKNQSIGEMLTNSPSCLVIQSHKNKDLEITKINSISEGENILYILNGVPVSFDTIKNLKPDEIKSVKRMETKELNFSINKEYVIVVTTKDLNSKSNEYDLTVLDLGYDNFLKMQPSAGTFTLNYLQNKNQRYVSVWNQRVLIGNPEIYEMPIDYDSKIFYGLEFEHKLYMFFKFIEEKHSVSLL